MPIRIYYMQETMGSAPKAMLNLCADKTRDGVAKDPASVMIGDIGCSAWERRGSAIKELTCASEEVDEGRKECSEI